jgi:hypothetical protein
MLCKDLIRYIGEKLDYKSIISLISVRKDFETAIDTHFWERLLKKRFGYKYDKNLDNISNLKFYYPILECIIQEKHSSSFDIIRKKKYLGLIKYIVDYKRDYIPLEYLLHFTIEIEHEELIVYILEKENTLPFAYAMLDAMEKKNRRLMEIISRYKVNWDNVMNFLIMYFFEKGIDKNKAEILEENINWITKKCDVIDWGQIIETFKNMVHESLYNMTEVKSTFWFLYGKELKIHELKRSDIVCLNSGTFGLTQIPVIDDPEILWKHIGLMICEHYDELAYHHMWRLRERYQSTYDYILD